MMKRKINRKILFEDEIMPSNEQIEELVEPDDTEQIESYDDTEKIEFYDDTKEIEEFLGGTSDLKISVMKNFSGAIENENSVPHIFLRKLHSLVRSSEPAGLVGVFGMNSDNVVNNAIYDLRRDREIIFLGKIHQSQNIDIYNNILACILNFMDNKTPTISSFKKREIYSKINTCSHFSSYNVDECDLPLEKLIDISTMSERDYAIRDILYALNHLLRGYCGIDKKFVLVIEMTESSFKYTEIKKLYNLTSQNIVIIVRTLLNFELANIIFCRPLYLDSSEYSGIHKFFDTSNIFTFD